MLCQAHAQTESKEVIAEDDDYYIEWITPEMPPYAAYMRDVKRRCDNNNETALDLAVALSNVGDVAFPAPVQSAFLWPIWWNAFANFDGYDSSCF